jgi:acyl transferase domain-containing protein/3-hydroxymyristoyl/3-hydroxydecanoyl-(acyl carrier protein) dehydratase
LVAQALGLRGPAYTLDAACASSLYALKLAILELESRRADVMITGGVSRPDPLYTQMGFSQLRALSPRGKPAPFDVLGDGLIVGEGAGLFVLKRVSDAVRQGDRIAAVIRGMGLSNDIHGDLLAPSSEGQLRAMRAAYQQAGWAPSDVDLIECHATGTPVGDAVEIASLKQLWGEAGSSWTPGQCTIGSVKSNVGHMLTAAGSAGLLKLLLAIEQKTLPPTANLSQVAPRLELEQSPFTILKTPRAWPVRAPGCPRRAALSGFGFGGINAHLLIEEWIAPAASDGGTIEPSASPALEHPSSRPRPMAIVGMAAHFGPLADLRAVQEQILGGALATPAERSGNRGLYPGETYAAPANGPAGQVTNEPGDRAGFYLDAYALSVDRFRIPPRELSEILPQQSLMLDVAARALEDGRWDAGLGLRTGVLIGLGLDQNTNNYQLRWWLAEQAPRWNEALDLGLSPEEVENWVEALRRGVGPALDANRTMGSLGGLVASRIAREFRIGGPCFSISCDETSGTQALQLAATLLDRSELDAVLVGAVDLSGDLRAQFALEHLVGAGQPGEGAAALLLKGLDDAVRDGDRIYAVCTGIGTVTGPEPATRSVDEESVRLAMRQAHDASRADFQSVKFFETAGVLRQHSCAAVSRVLGAVDESAFASGSVMFGSIEAAIGRPGAASGLAAVVASALCLFQQMLPGPGCRMTADAEIGPPGDAASGRPRFWLRNRAEGPRRAAVTAIGLGGSYHHLILEEPIASGLPADGLEIERAQPAGARPLALFALEAGDLRELAERAQALEALAERDPDGPIERLARAWWNATRTDRSLPVRMALFAGHVSELRQALRTVRQALEDGREVPPGPLLGTVAKVVPPQPALGSARLAFVYPGLGNFFPGMGRELSALWPEILRAQDARCEFLADQFLPELWWGDRLPQRLEDHRGAVLGQVAAGSLATDLLLLLGVRPDAAIGYSMGESAALVSLGAWTDRDASALALRSSSLFATELAGACTAARRVWNLDPAEPVDWIAGIVPVAAEEVAEAIKGQARVYVLIRNLASETVIGGQRSAVQSLVHSLRCGFLELPAVSTLHCEIGRAVESEYRQLHDQPTITPADLAFYSAAWGRAYHPDRRQAAEAITAAAMGPIDFAAVIENAYADGVHAFIEMGPGSSCTRLIDRILAGRPHLACAVCPADRDALAAALEVVGQLIASRFAVDLEPLYGRQTRAVGHRPAESGSRIAKARRIIIEPRPQPMRLPELPVAARRGDAACAETSNTTAESPNSTTEIPSSTVAMPAGPPVMTPSAASLSLPPSFILSPLIRQTAVTEAATASAHEAFLRVARGSGELLSQSLKIQLGLLEAMDRSTEHDHPGDPGPSSQEDAAVTSLAEAPGPASGSLVLDRAACLEFAIGSIARVLGAEYAAIDGHPTRVRLPDEPLMLVDRIVELEGQPRSLSSGRVVTEHDILPGDWYLDAGKIPPCIAIESGQADLFLSAYLGIDFVTGGHAVYRLLDATVTFYRDLPSPGEVIRYDIRITRFFRQGETHLFRFEFDGTVGGEPLLSMRDGCAGFFSAQELAAGAGIVPKPLDAPTRTSPVTNSTPWTELFPASAITLDEWQVEALRAGRLADAFGPPFDRLDLAEPLPLPGGRMTLVHRVPTLDPAGGRFGLGIIRAEADIHPDDWFMVCHFVDDRVMPGTLMYECCLHTLRIFLMRLGWVGSRGKVAFEPLPGVANRLRCRGQVIESTRTVVYEVMIKELGFAPEPYVITDALMYADGKPIVEINDMALQLSGTNRDELELLWRHAQARGAGAPKNVPPYGKEQILAFAEGRPSAGFGERYRPFDQGRFIARLPRPPYQFLDRVIQVEGEAWRMAAGTSAVAEYDIPQDAWYFEAARDNQLPYAVLLEAALQPCGWVSAYMGSALASELPLKFRNLGGTATVHAAVGRRSGTLQSSVTATKVTRSAGMIIQHYDFAVRCSGTLVFDGSTYFGFFHPDALAQQVGIREPLWREPTHDERALAWSFPLPDQPPHPDRRWRMVERVSALLPGGGAAGLGFIEGTIEVDPDAWFFHAHFLDDPVWPGSLGLESLLQLLKVVAIEHHGAGGNCTFDAPCPGQPHSWVYRGQILPSSKRVATQAVITARDDAGRWIQADGCLLVDGKVIYQMNGFTLRYRSADHP